MSNKEDELFALSVTGDGEILRRPYTREDLDAAVSIEIAEMRADGRLGVTERACPAVEWLRNYRANYSLEIQAVPLDGQTFFVKSLSDADLVELSCLLSADGFGLWDLSSIESQQSYAAALLTVGVCAGQYDDSRFFGSILDAKSFFALPGVAALYSHTLRSALIELNPHLLKKNEREPEMATLPLPI